MSDLVIVESPAKAKTIKKYLGSGYDVIASMGHIRDLPKSKLGVDIENGFSPDYSILDGKKKLANELKEKAESKQEKKELIEAAGVHLNDDELDRVAGGKEYPKITIYDF